MAEQILRVDFGEGPRLIKREVIEIVTERALPGHDCEWRDLGHDCPNKATHRVFPRHDPTYEQFACDRHLWNTQKDFEREFAQWPEGK